jgi:sec-independent protein translocase protein TatB
LEDLRGLRDFNPRNAVRRTLFDSDPDPAPVKPNGYAGPNGSSAAAAAAPRLNPASGPRSTPTRPEPSN